MHEPKSFQVDVPPDQVARWRLRTSDAARADDYESNFAVDARQQWPKWGEDWATYFAISCFELEWQAIELARSVNARLVRRGDRRRWEYVEMFTVNGHEGHAVAREGHIEGHHSAWGDAAGFYSSRDGRVPIQE